MASHAYYRSMSLHYAGELAALGTACCRTITSMSFEAAGKRIGSLSLNGIRLAMALVFLTFWCWIQRGRHLPLDASGHARGWAALSGVIGGSSIIAFHIGVA